ncbi:MAG: polyphosphate polymerase domain-containing protein [Muribaculaceae bacterium]|nr:polyphosphate polymerase domain-containing protein [Muribaculaceae bacterium]MBQ3910189.1 polyphosphate polymerase domain-containing protein [Muribaculaceae bacterium]
MNALLNTFAPITLAEMKSVRLMNRVDTKFVTTLPRLMQLLEMAKGEYFVQEIDGERNSAYTTLYYDTPRLDMYIMHHNGCLGRQKVRVRQYVDSNLTFLEVKNKNNHRRTRKKRITVTGFDITGEQQREFLKPLCWWDVDTLQPALRNWFNRITLVNKAKTERVTIDTGLRFHNCMSGLDKSLDQVVIIELKRDGNQPSPLLAMLRDLHIHPYGFSKYCMGTALSNPSVKKNRLKPKLHYVERLLREV